MFSELLSSFPAATCAALLQASGTFSVSDGKKSTVRVGHAACACRPAAACSNSKQMVSSMQERRAKAAGMAVMIMAWCHQAALASAKDASPLNGCTPVLASAARDNIWK